MALHLYLVAIGILSCTGLLEGVPQGAGNPTSSSQYPYEEIRPGKYAAVIVRYSSWQGARSACESDLPGASLFSVESAADSYWIGQRINIEKDQFTGSSKFWVGLTSAHSRKWLTGGGFVSYPEVVQIDGDEDSEKIYAWAVPDSKGRLKYEFLTPSDEAEAFICQYSAGFYKP